MVILMWMLIKFMDWLHKSLNTTFIRQSYMILSNLIFSKMQSLQLSFSSLLFDQNMIKICPKF